MTPVVLLLLVDNPKTWFLTRAGIVRVVNGLTFSVEKGQTVGIVGESGSGTSVTCYSMLGLIPMPPGKIEGGIAQLVEQLTFNQWVTGSNPVRLTTEINDLAGF